MSGIKRTFLAEECSATTTDNNIQSSSPNDSPQSKKIRRSSSHHTTESENDDDDNDAQDEQYEPENGISNGKNYFLNEDHLDQINFYQGHSPVQSEEEEDDEEDDDDDEEDEEATEAEPEGFSDDSIVHVSFDNGKDDSK